MSYNVACSAGAKVVVEGEALSLNGLHKVIDLCSEYESFLPITIVVHTSDTKPKNIIRYLPVQDFRFAEDYKHAALIDYDLDDGDEEEEEDEDEDEEREEATTSTNSGRFRKKYIIRISDI